MNNELDRAVRDSSERMDAFILSGDVLADPGRVIPDRKVIIEITEQLRSVLFPGFFDVQSPLANPYATGSALSRISCKLLAQCEAAFGYLKDGTDVKKKAEETVTAFVKALPEVQKLLYTDVEALYMGDPAAFSKVDVIFSYPGLLAITVYRVAHILYDLKVPLIPRMMTEYAHGLTGIDINAGAEIGSYFFIDHGTGVVIGETTVIGSYVKLYQGVTLGALSTRRGQKLSGIKRHPTIGNRVTVYSGASILGGETVIGDDCVIGGNAFVTKSVPSKTRVSVKSAELTFREMDTDVWENA